MFHGFDRARAAGLIEGGFCRRHSVVVRHASREADWGTVGLANSAQAMR
jgi:hypothetical protein